MGNRPHRAYILFSYLDASLIIANFVLPTFQHLTWFFSIVYIHGETFRNSLALLFKAKVPSLGLSFHTRKSLHALSWIFTMFVSSYGHCFWSPPLVPVQYNLYNWFSMLTIDRIAISRWLFFQIETFKDNHIKCILLCTLKSNNFLAPSKVPDNAEKYQVHVASSLLR